MRMFELERITKETEVRGALCLEGEGRSEIRTGIGFFDHMLDLFAFHSGFDLTMRAKGDLEVCDHHTIEDCGIVLGTLIREALGDKRGIHRVWHVYAADGRNLVQRDAGFKRPAVFGVPLRAEPGKIGEYSTE